jgi:hypothetical protein
MPVVEKTSDIINNMRLQEAPPDPSRARGRPVVATFTVANAADDFLGSRFLLVRLPSFVILDSRTAFKADTWGFATTQIGTRANPTALLNAARAALHQPIAFGDARHGQPLWQALGLAADPGGEIELFAYAVANATGAGTMRGEIHYRTR